MATALLRLLMLLSLTHDPSALHASSAPPLRCDPSAVPIEGGWGEPLEGGVRLRYRCPPGSAPRPSAWRRCGPTGVWDPLPGGGTPRCQVLLCPPQLEFEQGWVTPLNGTQGVRGAGVAGFPPGSILEFSCFGGFTLRGPRTRRCAEGGRWDGATPACDDGAGACPAPGVPAGATKEGSRLGVEGVVRYRCGPGLELRGSSQRRCLEGGSWSGVEPECRDPDSFDHPEDVAGSFLASLTHVVEVAEANSTHGPTAKRRIRVGPGEALDIFLVLDASHSISRQHFGDARRALGALVEKIASLGATPRYGVVTFGTEARVALSPTDPSASDAAHVQQLLQELSLAAHAGRSGTNPQAALGAVYGLLVQAERDEEQRGLRPAPTTTSTRHVIVIVTDGRWNMGGSPVPSLRRIREFLSIGRDPQNDREDFLDVYVFGVGAAVHTETLNALASHKDGERHYFRLEGVGGLEETFHLMIDESSTLGLCGVTQELQDSSSRDRNPWQVTITITRPGRGVERCQGSLVSPYFVLTAAHCFTPDDEARLLSVTLDEQVTREVTQILIHDLYSLGGRRDRGVPEFYDYDVSLLRLATPIQPSASHRPICLPCTEGASRALRLPKDQNSCSQHRRLLLPPKLVGAFFVSASKPSQLERKEVTLKLGKQRALCEADALKAPPYVNVTSLDDVITPRFLCSGGAQPSVDPNACRGDSGGPVVVPWGKRYFQVGVLSWGVLDVCKMPPPHPSFARDFHINLLEVLPWLRQQLRDEDLGFLPDDP